MIDHHNYCILIFKDKKLLRIHKSLNQNGNTELFDKENLSKYEVNNEQDLILLVLPNFSMKTPFHFLLECYRFEIIIRLVNSIEKKNSSLNF